MWLHHETGSGLKLAQNKYHHMVKLALKLLPSATSTPDLAQPGLREDFGLNIASGSLKYPIMEKEMADFEP